MSPADATAESPALRAMWAALEAAQAELDAARAAWNDTCDSRRA